MEKVTGIVQVVTQTVSPNIEKLLKTKVVLFSLKNIWQLYEAKELHFSIYIKKYLLSITGKGTVSNLQKKLE